MFYEDTVAGRTFHQIQTKEKEVVEFPAVVQIITDFLEHYGGEYLLGRDFSGIVGTGSGDERFERLLTACGYEEDAQGFCKDLLAQLESANHRNEDSVRINGVAIPKLLLTAVLELVIVGERFTSIKTVERLEDLTNLQMPPEERDPMRQVLETYPVRMSTHLLRQMRVSPDVAYQYMPFVEELDPVGHVNTWIGQFHQGLLEQMYQNRVIFLLNMSCPVYCRFCFRKHKESRNQANPSVEDVRQAVAHVARTPTIKEIVITGGDPLMNRSNLACAIDGLKKIPHVQTLRLATRSVAYYPNLFYAKDGSLLKYIKSKSLELQLKGKRLEIATHFIHPDEISIESLDLISQFAKSGIAVYVQTPFLKDCNDEGPELVRLYHLLRGAGAELHYIYIPCSPIHGNNVYWAPISMGIDVAHHLRAHLSDRVIPRICTATPIGKMDWNSSGWAISQDQDNEHFIRIRTPYTPEYFKAFAPLANDLEVVEKNEEGTIDVRYMAQIGDPSLFLGNRRPHTSKSKPFDKKSLEKLRQEALEDQRDRQSIVTTGCPGVYRVHKTRVEIDAMEKDAIATCVSNSPDVTDVVVSARDDAVNHLHAFGRIVDALQKMPGVNAVRLRSLSFNYAPERFNRGVLDRLGSMNRLTVADPLRLEIETQFLHADEVLPEHGILAGRLRNLGITVYNNTPLLSGVNDSPDAINRLAFRLRECGIEFHHLYISGLPLQQFWGRDRPVDVADVIDIASRVRKDGSGREIPRYIIRTRLGEVDFGLTSKLFKKDGALAVRLSPYDLSYYKKMQPDFKWPEGVEIDADGKPMIPVSGLHDTGDFMVF